jgi:hypothetical protein
MAMQITAPLTYEITTDKSPKEVVKIIKENKGKRRNPKMLFVGSITDTQFQIKPRGHSLATNAQGRGRNPDHYAPRLFGQIVATPDGTTVKINAKHPEWYPLLLVLWAMIMGFAAFATWAVADEQWLLVFPVLAIGLGPLFASQRRRGAIDLLTYILRHDYV